MKKRIEIKNYHNNDYRYFWSHDQAQLDYLQNEWNMKGSLQTKNNVIEAAKNIIKNRLPKYIQYAVYNSITTQTSCGARHNKPAPAAT